MINPNNNECGWSFEFQSQYKNHDQVIQEGRDLQKLTEGDVTTRPSLYPFSREGGGIQEVQCRFGQIGPDGNVDQTCALKMLRGSGRRIAPRAGCRVVRPLEV